MPVLIRPLDDDEATIIMVDSNLQREKILPSEKAFAYKMKLEALKHQGKRRDLTSEPAVPKLTAREKIAQDAGENCGLTVTRYIALTRLIPPLLALVDEDKLAVSTAADYISDLAKQEQAVRVKLIRKVKTPCPKCPHKLGLVQATANPLCHASLRWNVTTCDVQSEVHRSPLSETLKSLLK